MQNYFFVFALLFVGTIGAQTDQQIDSVNVKICERFQSMNSLTEETYLQTFAPFIGEMAHQFNIQNEEDVVKLYERMHFRLQKNCAKFIQLLNALYGQNGEWVMVKEKPVNSLSKKEIEGFFELRNFSYKEANGDVTQVWIDSNLWQDIYADGTTSKLKLQRTSELEFELIFLESDNLARKNLSSKGERYRYGIYGKSDTAYSCWVASEDGFYHCFRLYFN